MKKKQAIAGLLVAASLATGALAANGINTTITVFKGGINVVKDGQALTMKDANGTVVEPMAYQGTTYLPVRAVAEAAGLNVEWDGATRTVILGGKDVTYLDELAPLSFEGTESTDQYTAVSDVKYDKVTYKSGIKIVIDPDTDGVDSVATLEYPLDGNYRKFIATLACTRGGAAYYGTEVKITGDGKELYRSPLMTSDSRAFALDLDVTGVRTMEVKLTTRDSAEENYSWQNYSKEFQLLDARLVK